MTNNKRLRRLEEELEGYLEETPDDTEEDPLNKKIPNSPTIGRAYKSLRKEDQRDEEPAEEAITVLKAGQQDEDWITILAREPDTRKAFRKLWEGYSVLGKDMDPQAKENLQKAEELADNDG